MTDIKFELYQLREMLKNPQTSEIFHHCLMRLSEMVYQIEVANQPTTTARKISFKDITFPFAVNPGTDIRENLDIEFENCTFGDFVQCSRFSSMAFQNCKINRLIMAHGATQLHVIGGSIHELQTPWDTRAKLCMFDDVEIDYFQVTRNLEEIFFNGCTFIREVSCNLHHDSLKIMHNLYFTDCVFKCAPDFMGCEFSKSVSFSRCKFVENSDALGKYYRDLKHKMSNNQDELSASFFGGLEMKSKHGDLKFGIEYCLSHGYSLLSDHGLDQFRPVRLLGWLAVVAFLAWGVVLAWSGVFAQGDQAGEHLNPFMQIIYLTFLSILGPLRLLGGFNLLKIDTFATQLLMFGFTASASLLWFFIILAVRRRFKVG